MRIASFVVAIVGLAGLAGAQVAHGQRPPPPYGPGYGQQQVINCGSRDYRLQRCRLPSDWRSVRLVRQTSDAACVPGQTFGVDPRGLWVDRGCSGDFADARNGGGWRPGPGWNHDFTMSCGSPQYNYNFCQVDVGRNGHVVLRRQISDRRCVLGANWGWNRAGIWVDKGCSAQFTVVRRW